jgi:hypothetical protein
MNDQRSLSGGASDSAPASAPPVRPLIAGPPITEPTAARPPIARPPIAVGHVLVVAG